MSPQVQLQNHMSTGYPMTQQPHQAPINPATVPTNPVAPVVQAPAVPQTVAPQAPGFNGVAPAPVAPATPIQAQNVQVAPPPMPAMPTPTQPVVETKVSNWDGMPTKNGIPFLLIGESSAYYKFMRWNETGQLNKDGLPTRGSRSPQDGVLANTLSIAKEYWGGQTPAIGTLLYLHVRHDLQS